MVSSIVSKHEISDDFTCWKYIITYYDDVTSIEYYEKENLKWICKDTFNIIAGFDLEIFEAAIPILKDLRKSE